MRVRWRWDPLVIFDIIEGVGITEDDLSKQAERVFVVDRNFELHEKLPLSFNWLDAYPCQLRGAAEAVQTDEWMSNARRCNQRVSDLRSPRAVKGACMHKGRMHALCASSRRACMHQNWVRTVEGSSGASTKWRNQRSIEIDLRSRWWRNDGC